MLFIVSALMASLLCLNGWAGEMEWTSIGPGVRYGFNTLAIDPRDPSRLYAASRTEGLLKSVDGGYSWSAAWVSQVVGSDPVVTDIVVDPHHPGIVYIKTSDEGILKSADGGETWFGITFRLSKDAGVPSFLEMDPLQPDVIYAGGTGSESGLFKSTDGGLIWNKVFPEPIAAVLRSQYDPQVLYALHDSRTALFKSYDGGTNWTLTTSSMPSFWRFHAIAVDPRNPEVVYVGGAVLHENVITGEIFKSEDSGATWTQIFSLPDTWIRALAIDPNNPRVLYTGSYGKIHNPGFFRSINGGESWTNLHSYPVEAIRIDPQNPNTVYAAIPSGAGGIIRFTFSGQSTAVERTTWGEVKRKR